MENGQMPVFFRYPDGKKENKKSNIEYKMYEEEDDEMKHWK